MREIKKTVLTNLIPRRHKNENVKTSPFNMAKRLAARSAATSKRRRVEERPTAAALKRFVLALQAYEPNIRAYVYAFFEPIVDRRGFDTAAAAFNNLNGAERFSYYSFTALAKKALRRLTYALGPVANYKRGSSVELLMYELFKSGPAQLGSSSWKCVAVKGSRHICFFSDAREFNRGRAMELALRCDAVGLTIRIFEWDYPELACEDGYYPPARSRIHSWGYSQLFRGKLVGFIVE